MMKLALVCVLALAAVSLSSLLAQHEVDRILTRVAGFYHRQSRMVNMW